MITISHKGNFNNIEKFFRGVTTSDYTQILDRYAKEGLNALISATPVSSGKTASSWGYEVKKTKNGASITWTNSNIVGDVPIVILIQYGHATKEGGYVQGRDFINPALRPIFDGIANSISREVSRL